MFDVLLISQNRSFRDKYRLALRKEGFPILARDDIFEGLKEFQWYPISLIIWDIRSHGRLEHRALTVLKNKYPRVRLLLVSDDREQSDELAPCCNGILLGTESSEELVAKVGEQIGRPSFVQKPGPDINAGLLERARTRNNPEGEREYM